MLIHYNIVKNNYLQNSSLLYKFVPDKSFCQFLDVSRKNFIFLKAFDSEFPYFEVWSTDQDSKVLDVEDKINITLVID